MKSHLLIFLLFLALCSCNTPKNECVNASLQTSLRNNEAFVGNVGNDEYAVFVSSASPSEIKGHSFLINGRNNDTLSFCLKINDLKIVFEQNGSANKYKLKNLKINADEISGVVKYGLFRKEDFIFRTYTIPEYVERTSRRYKEQLFDVDTVTDVKYGSANGYWTSTSFDYDIGDILEGQGRTLSERKLDLLMDVYLPKNDTLKKRPLIMFIHGGAFYVGCKDDLPMQEWCSHYASLGYVTASIDYRMGFRPTKRSIERAGYAAIQDAHAAMRYLVENQSVYGIDTSMIFVGGTSAGAITALHLAFMTKETRPETSYDGLFDYNMGDIEHSGNLLDDKFTIKGVVDMWGAVYDIEMIDSKRIPVAAFHGDRDEMVPYGYDYPFTMIGSACKLLFNKMYGSSVIVDRLLRNGVNDSKMYTLYNMPHSPHVENGRELTDVFYYIQDRMDPFFRDIAMHTEIVADGNSYRLSNENATNITWHTDGGIILDNQGDNIRVAWFGNAPEHKIKASGIIRGEGFVSEKEESLIAKK